MNVEEMKKELLNDLTVANDLQREIMNELYAKSSNHNQLVISMLLMERTIKLMLAPENTNNGGKTILFLNSIIDEIFENKLYEVKKRPARKNDR